MWNAKGDQMEDDPDNLEVMDEDSDSLELELTSRKRCLGNSWYYMHRSLLMNIFQYLSAEEMVKAGMTCSNWYQASLTDYLWKDLLRKDFKIDSSIGMAPGQSSWRQEYIRLANQTPLVQTDMLKEHKDQVLHVSFSHNGKMFATCSKDGTFVVWNANHPVSVKYQKDMRSFSWKYTQFSQFNQSDTLLLVSGVHFGTPQSTSGEIAVFSLTNGLDLQCRVRNKPFDIFGAWYGDQHLLSGDLRLLDQLFSQSILWLNKASQETASEHIPIMNQMFRFYNCNASSIRAVMVAQCLMPDCSQSHNETPSASQLLPKPCCSSDLNSLHQPMIPKNAAPSNKVFGAKEKSLDQDHKKTSESDRKDTNTIAYNAEYRLVEKESNVYVEDDRCGDDISDKSEVSEVSEMSADAESSDDELCVKEDKFLIFTMGSETYTPHQIGIKRVKPVSFPRRMDPGLSLRERIANRAREQQLARDNPHDFPLMNPDNLEYDKVDHLLDLHGHIIGMGLSPDHRFLYVNTRPWPRGYVFENPLIPPPIAQEIDIHVIDLVTMKEVGTMLRSHKAYTSNHECFFIFLDVCKEYVASGAEDKHGYMWDRHYGICLVKFPHQDVVNSVAFNPKDSEMLLTVSDDNSIKVWHSYRRTKELRLNPRILPRALEMRKLPRSSVQASCSHSGKDER